MTAARDMVTALTELAEYLHAKGKGSANLYAKRAYQDAAARVDEVNTGPAFGAVLAEMDAQTGTDWHDDHGGLSDLYGPGAHDGAPNDMYGQGTEVEG